MLRLGLAGGRGASRPSRGRLTDEPSKPSPSAGGPPTSVPAGLALRFTAAEVAAVARDAIAMAKDEFLSLPNVSGVVTTRYRSKRHRQLLPGP